MWRGVNSLGVLVSALILALLTVWIPGCDVQTNRYATTHAARADGVFERGWIPDVLPPSAHGIVETHDLDTNHRCAAVSVPLSERRKLKEELLATGFTRAWTGGASVDGNGAVGARVAGPFEHCPFDLPEPSALSNWYRRGQGASRGAVSSRVEHVLVAQPAEAGEPRLYFWSE